MRTSRGTRTRSPSRARRRSSRCAVRALDEGSSYRAQSSEPHCAGMGATVGAQEYALCRAVPPAELRVCGWRGRLRVTRDVRVGCATELVPCANGWVGSRVRECGVRVLPYNEIMQGVPQEEDDLKLQFIIAGAGTKRAGAGTAHGSPGGPGGYPRRARPSRRRAARRAWPVPRAAVMRRTLAAGARSLPLAVSRFQPLALLFTVTVGGSCVELSTSCVSSRVPRARLLSPPAHPFPLPLVRFPRDRILRLAEPPKS